MIRNIFFFFCFIAFLALLMIVGGWLAEHGFYTPPIQSPTATYPAPPR